MRAVRGSNSNAANRARTGPPPSSSWAASASIGPAASRLATSGARARPSFRRGRSGAGRSRRGRRGRGWRAVPGRGRRRPGRRKEPGGALRAGSRPATRAPAGAAGRRADAWRGESAGAGHPRRDGRHRAGARTAGCRPGRRGQRTETSDPVDEKAAHRLDGGVVDGRSDQRLEPVPDRGRPQGTMEVAGPSPVCRPRRGQARRTRRPRGPAPPPRSERWPSVARSASAPTCAASNASEALGRLDHPLRSAPVLLVGVPTGTKPSPLVYRCPSSSSWSRFADSPRDPGSSAPRARPAGRTHHRRRSAPGSPSPPRRRPRSRRATAAPSSRGGPAAGSTGGRPSLVRRARGRQAAGRARERRRPGPRAVRPR